MFLVRFFASCSQSPLVRGVVLDRWRRREVAGLIGVARSWRTTIRERRQIRRPIQLKSVLAIRFREDRHRGREGERASYTQLNVGLARTASTSAWSEIIPAHVASALGGVSKATSVGLEQEAVS